MLSNPLRVALIAPLIESVPPPGYGGTERVISVLAEELVRRGHAVTLFASGDSVTSASLVPGVPRALRVAGFNEYIAPTLAQLETVYESAVEFDVIHSHVDAIAFPFAARCATPTVSTVHLRLDSEDAQERYAQFAGMPLVSISDAQRVPMPDANWLATVYHGTPVANVEFRPEPGDYLAFLGRMSPEKRPDRAIQIALEMDRPLVMAGKIDPVWDGDYFERVVEPKIKANPRIEFIGEVDDAQKHALLGGALAYLFPIDWPEPFGLTVVEAMATGTPVVATNLGSMPELVLNGVTGFTCATLAEMVRAVGRIGEIDRAACRAHVEARFSPAAMTTAYERVYRRLIG